MYRARAEAVSGTRVYANGKWLKCIGNKPVSVGDYVWTDGRCVYGHLQESEQPKVITAPPEDEGIPITIIENPNTTPAYTFSAKTLRKKDAKKIARTAYASCRYINDSKKNVYAGTPYLESEFFIDGSGDYGSAIHDFHYGHTVGVNIDKLGNVYELREIYVSSSRPTDVNPFGNAHASKLELHIIKNGETISVRDLSKYLKQASEEAVAKMGGFYTGSLPETGFMPDEDRLYVARYAKHGVIENENSWAYMVEIDSNSRTGYPDWENSTAWFTPALIAAGAKRILYLCTPDGDKPIVNIGYSTNPSDLEETYDEYDISPPEDKIPIQDGYYFKINSLKESQKYTVDIENISIYSPNGREIFRGDFYIGAYLLIYKGRLLGVRGGNVISPEDGVQDGLYLIKNGELTSIAEGSVLNWKLRPMKRWRNWQNRIKKFPLELNETDETE